VKGDHIYEVGGRQFNPKEKNKLIESKHAAKRIDLKKLAITTSHRTDREK